MIFAFLTCQNKTIEMENLTENLSTTLNVSVLEDEIPIAYRIVEGMVLITICFLSVVGNFMLWFIVCSSKTLRTLSNALLLCLSTADILVSVINMPMTVYTILVGEWRFSETLCTTLGFLNMTTFVASVMSLAAISWNRYIAICKSVYYKRYFNKRNTALVVTGVWMLSLGLATPPLLGWGTYAYLPEQSFCFCYWSSSVSYTFFMVVTCFGIPCISMTFCYVCILKEVRASRKRVRHFAQPECSSKQSPVYSFSTATKNLNSITGCGRTINSDRPNGNSHRPTALSLPPVEVGSGSFKHNTGLKAPENLNTSKNVNTLSVSKDIGSLGTPSKISSFGIGKDINSLNLSGKATIEVPGRTGKINASNSPFTRRGRKFPNGPMSYQQKQLQKQIQEDLKLTLSLLVVIIIFIIAWLPFCISMFWSVFSPNNPPPRSLDMFSLLLGYANSCCNPIVYGLMNKRFNTAFKRVLKCQCRYVIKVAPMSYESECSTKS